MEAPTEVRAMNKPTDHYVTTIRHTGRGSDYFGHCEICGKTMAEAVVAVRHQVYAHADGFFYLAAPSGGRYAHLQCLTQGGREVVLHETLPRRGRLLEYPRGAIVRAYEQVGIPKPQAEAAVDELAVTA